MGTPPLGRGYSLKSYMDPLGLGKWDALDTGSWGSKHMFVSLKCWFTVPGVGIVNCRNRELGRQSELKAMWQGLLIQGQHPQEPRKIAGPQHLS